MGSPPGTSTGTGTRGTKLSKLTFALLDAYGLDAIDERQHLSLESDQLRAGLAETSVVVGELSHLAQALGWRGDVLRSALAAIRENGTGMEFSVGAAAVGFSATSAERVHRAGQERFAAEKGFQQWLDLLTEGEQL
jgi:hypothetical protein